MAKERFTWRRDGAYHYLGFDNGLRFCRIERYSGGNGHYSVWSIEGNTTSQQPTLRDAKALAIRLRAEPAVALYPAPEQT